MEAYSPGEEDYLRRDAGDGSSELQDGRREDGARSPDQGPAVAVEAGGGRSGRRRGTIARRGHGRHSPSDTSERLFSPCGGLDEDCHLKIMTVHERKKRL
jgi:hypothetical protein